MKLTLIKEEVRQFLKESRLDSKYAEYEVKKDKILVELKNQKAAALTKYVQAWTELDNELESLKEQKRKLNDLENIHKEKSTELKTNLRPYIVDLVDAEEATMTIIVESQGAQITLSKETQETTKEIEKTDYIKIYDEIYNLLKDNQGLISQLEEIKKNATTLETTISKSERSLRMNVKEGIFDDIVSKIKSVFDKFKMKIAKLFTLNSKRVDEINKKIKGLK